MRGQGLRVVLALVAEQRPELLQALCGLDQHHPIEVPALVPQVTEQRAVVLAEVLALALALDGVGLDDVDGDQPVEMAGGGVAHEVEGKPALAARGGVERQIET